MAKVRVFLEACFSGKNLKIRSSKMHLKQTSTVKNDQFMTVANTKGSRGVTLQHQLSVIPQNYMTCKCRQLTEAHYTVKNIWQEKKIQLNTHKVLKMNLMSKFKN